MKPNATVLRFSSALGGSGVLISPDDSATFALTPEMAGVTGIKCLRCGLISYNTNDIEKKYCGRCDAFHSNGK